MADVKLLFRADTKAARQQVNQLVSEFKNLRTATAQTSVINKSLSESAKTLSTTLNQTADINKTLTQRTLDNVRVFKELIPAQKGADVAYKETAKSIIRTATETHNLNTIAKENRRIFTGAARGVKDAGVAFDAADAALDNFIRGGGKLGRFLIDPVGLAITTISTLAEAWRGIYSDFQKTKPFEDATEQIEAFDLAFSKTAQSLENQSGFFDETTGENFELLASRADELRQAIIRLINAGDDPEKIRELRTEYKTLLDQLQNLSTLDPFVAIEESTTETKTAAAELTSEFQKAQEQIKALTTETAGEAGIRKLGEETKELVDFTRELPGVILPADTAIGNMHLTMQAAAVIASEYKGEISELEEIIRRYAEYGARLPDFEVRVVDAEAEKTALEEVTARIIQQTQDAEGLAHVYELLARRTDAHNAKLVNVNETYGETARVTKDVESISQDVTTAVRDQEGAFSDLRTETGATEVGLITLDENLQAVNETIKDDLVENVGDLDEAFENLGLAIPGYLSGALEVLASINTDIEGVSRSVKGLVSSAASGDGLGFLAGIPDLVRSLNELQTNENLTTEARSAVAFDVISQIQASDIAPEQQETLISPIRDYIRELLIRSILSVPQAISPALILQHESFARTHGLDFNFARDRQALGLGNVGFQTPFDLPEINLSGVIATLQTLQQASDAVEEPTPTTGGKPPRNTQQILAGQGRARARAESEGTDRQATEDVARLQYGDVAYDAEVAAATAETEAAAEQTSETAKTVFRFSAEQRDALGTLAGDITDAENAIKLLGEDSTAAEVLAAYTALGTAETAYYDKQLEFINAGAGIFTDTALQNARTQAFDGLTDTAFDANQRLVRNLEDVGFQLTNAFDATSGFLMGSSLAIQAIAIPPEPIEPIEIVDATPPDRLLSEPIQRETGGSPEPETLEDPPTGQILPREDLKSVFRFSAVQRDALANLAGDITDAENAIKLLSEDSTPEQVTAAYTELGKAETAYYEKQIEFIDAGFGIFTGTALQNARTQALSDFQGTAFDANQELIRNLGDVGFELVTMFNATSGFLSDTALAIQAIPIPPLPIEPAKPDTRNTGRGGLNLLQNAIDRAQFELTGATSEADFETRRRNLITAITEYYDAEDKRIEGLKLSEDELKDLRQDTELDREKAIARATGLSNRFAEDRIREENRVADETARATEKTAAYKLKAEQTLADDIAKIREDQLEAEQEYRDAIAELEEEHQEKLTDIVTKANRDREDINRNANRDFQDIFRESQSQIAELLLKEGISAEDARNFLAGFEGDVRSRLSDEGRAELSRIANERLDQEVELRRERDRDLEDVDIAEARDREDTVTERERDLEDIKQRATATYDALQNALEPLLGEQGTFTAAITAQTDAAEQTNSASEKLDTVAQEISDSDISGAIELTRESAEASLKISTAIEEFPGILTNQLTNGFERIFDDLEETIIKILEIEKGIQGGVGQFLLDTLIESEGRNVGIVGQTAAFALKAIGIKPEQFIPQEPTSEILEGKIPSLESIEKGIMTGFTEQTEMTAETISVSGNIVNVSGGSRDSESLDTSEIIDALKGINIGVTVPVTLNDNILIESDNRTEQIKEITKL